MRPLQNLVTGLAGRGLKRSSSALPLLFAFQGRGRCAGQ